MMRLVPYYTKRVTSSLSHEAVLNKISIVIRENLINNFIENTDFIGGEVKNGHFKLFKSTGMVGRGFPLMVHGQVNDDGTWTLVFRSNYWWSLITSGLMIFWTFYYKTSFFVPILTLGYFLGVIFFNKDSRAFEKILELEFDLK